jgi:hypothetical protein
VREIAEPPVELLAALTTGWCTSVSAEDGSAVYRIGRWLVLRQFDEDADDDPIVLSTRCFLFDTDDDAMDTLDVLLDAEGIP